MSAEETKKRASDLKAIEGHKNFYRSLKSEIIYYKDSTTPKFSTGETQITKAKKVVERRKLLLAGNSEKDAHEKINNISNPLIKSDWDELMRIKKSDHDPATMLKYEVSWNHGLAGFWEKKTRQDLNDKNLQEFKDWYLREKPTRGAAHTVIHLGMLIRHLHKKKKIQELPDLDIIANLDDIIASNTKRKKPGRRFDEETEVKPMIAAAKEISEHYEYLCARAFLGVKLGVRCGLRKTSEALKLKWENIDFQKRLMHVWSMKNKKWRAIHLTDDMIQAFKWQQRFTGQSEWVFARPEKPDEHIKSQVFDKVWVKVKQKAGIKGWDKKNDCRFHDLRHTFASQTADDNWPPKAACDVLDMSLAEYDETYAKSSAAKRAEMMERSFGSIDRAEDFKIKSDASKSHSIDEIVQVVMAKIQQQSSSSNVTKLEKIVKDAILSLQHNNKEEKMKEKVLL